MLQRKLDYAERNLQALNMRLAGASYDDIARAIGVANRSVAWKAVQAALGAAITEPAQELIAMECQRLDRLLRSLWPFAIGIRIDTRTDGSQVVRNVDPDLFAVDRVLDIMSRRAKLLGLDAPTKKQISGEWVMRGAAEKVAEAYGLDVKEVIAQAERLLANAAED